MLRFYGQCNFVVATCLTVRPHCLIYVVLYYLSGCFGQISDDDDDDDDFGVCSIRLGIAAIARHSSLVIDTISV